MLGTVLNTLARIVPTLLPKLLTERPDLLVDHALAYAALATTEIELAKRRWIRRIVAAAIALASVLSFIVLTGVALMLFASTQPQQGTPWMLWLVPGVMLLVAIISTVIALSGGGHSATGKASLGAQVREQIQLDMQVFRLAMESRS